LTREDRGALAAAFGLAAIAGSVDGTGYLFLRGFFVSFMSGNSTRLGVAVLGHDDGALETAGGLFLLYVAGAFTGRLLSNRAGTAYRPVLVLSAALMSAAASCATLDFDRAAVGVAALALGAASLAVQKAGGISVGTTYITGTLVNMAKALADALNGGARFGWLPYLLLWAMLAGGAVFAALLYPLMGLRTMWLAAAGYAALAAYRPSAA